MGKVFSVKLKSGLAGDQSPDPAAVVPKPWRCPKCVIRSPAVALIGDR